jgi:hypothetical protein
MATIDNVTISVNGAVIATAPSGEIAPPPAANLTVEGATWTNGQRGALNYLQRDCAVNATALGRPFNDTYKITGITGGFNTIKLTQL